MKGGTTESGDGKKKPSPPRPLIMLESQLDWFSCQFLKLLEEATLQFQEIDVSRLNHQGNKSGLVHLFLPGLEGLKARGVVMTTSKETGSRP